MKIKRNTIFVITLVLTCLAVSGVNAQSKIKQKNDLDGTALEQFLTVEHDYIKVPITKLASGHLHINVVVNGVDGEFILDTGAGGTVIESNRKNKFKIISEDANGSIGVGTGGQQRMQKAKINTFKLGALIKNDFNVYLMNLDHVNKALFQWD